MLKIFLFVCSGPPHPTPTLRTVLISHQKEIRNFKTSYNVASEVIWQETGERELEPAFSS